jgi:LuxR family transcriptional regulator, maltose regulon positive regulatory protein
MMPPLLETKLFVPAPRPNRVLRARLQARLQQGLQGKLTLISAPAGFGKSSALAELAMLMDGPVCWLSLDASDSDPYLFFRYLIAALAQQHPGCGDTVAARLQQRDQPLDEPLFASLLNALAHLPQRTLLVLDDYHLLDNREIEQWLLFLLQRWPATVHLAIGTREDPALPLARWRVQGQLTEIRARDLRFSEDETTEFFRNTMGVSLSDTQAAALDQRTEGWAAGLQLAALSLQGETDRDTFIRDFTGSHRFVLDYLAEEVLQRLSPVQRQFLCACSVLKRFEAGLCAAVSDLPAQQAAALLAWLEQANLFLVPLDASQRWYRFHHLFADVLGNHAGLSLPQRQTLHARASQWFDEQGMAEEAIQYAVQSAEPERLASLLERHWPQMRFYSLEQNFMHWMQALPEAHWRVRPVLCVHYGLTLLSWDLDAGERILQQLDTEQNEPHLRQHWRIENTDAFASVPGILAIALAYLAGARGNNEAVLIQCQQALQTLPEHDFIWRGAAAAMQAMLHWQQGNMVQTLSSLHASLLAIDRSGDVSATLSAWHLMAQVHMQQGDWLATEQVIKQALQRLQAVEAPYPQAAADIYVCAAELALERGQLSQAHAHIATAESMGQAARLPQALHQLPLLKARCCWQQGEHAGALQWLAEAAPLQTGSPMPDCRPLPAWKARIALDAGQLWQLPETYRTTCEPNVPIDFLHEFDWLSRVRHQLQQLEQGEHRDRAETRPPLPLLQQALQTCLEQATRQQRRSSQLDCCLLLARLARLQADHAAQQHWLQQADFLGLNQLTSPERWIEDLRQPATNTGVEPPLNADNQYCLASEPLSSREIQVLQLLASELSGPDIADRLFISLNTFRTHSKNLYAKLDVRSRRAAVSRAYALGLLPRS